MAEREEKGRVSEDLISATEVADLAGISRPNIYRWLRRRGLEPVREEPLPVGRLYDRAEVLVARDAWLAERDRSQDARRSASAIARRER